MSGPSGSVIDISTEEGVRPVIASTAERPRVLLSMAEIARLASVHRPVVTTWRRRHTSFPNPAVADGSQPLFDGHAVAEWLVDTGRAARDTVEPDLWLYGLDQSDVAMAPRERLATITALICLRHLDDEELAESSVPSLRARARVVDPDDELLRGEVDALPEDGERLATLVDGLVEAAWGCRGALEQVLAARATFDLPELNAGGLPPELVELITGVSGVAERAAHSGSLVLADPAAGAGDLLTGVLRAMPESCFPTVVAAEQGRCLARLLRRRLAVRDLAFDDRDVDVAGDLGDDVDDPDVLVTQLPYEPAESRDPVDVLQRVGDAAVRLPAGRTAVVLGPADVLSGPLRPFSVAERERAKLLSQGVVEAVVRLPGGMVPFRPGYETALWVLTASHGSQQRGRVLLGDISDRSLNSNTVAELVTDVVTWRREDYRLAAHTRSWCVETEVAGLVESPGPLTAPRVPTARERNTDVPATVTRINELESTLAEAREERRPVVRTGLVQALPAVPALVSIDALVKAGELTVLQGSRIDPDDLTSDGHHPVIHSAALWRHSAPGEAEHQGSRALDRAVLAANYPRAKLTEPGDVLVTLSPAPAAVVDHDGFAVPEFPARALRITERGARRFTPRVLAMLLNAGGKTRASRAVRPPRTLEAWEIPALDPGTLRRAEVMLADLDRRREHVRAELAALDEVDRLAAAGISDGTLTFG